MYLESLDLITDESSSVLNCGVILAAPLTKNAQRQFTYTLEKHKEQLEPSRNLPSLLTFSYIYCYGIHR